MLSSFVCPQRLASAEQLSDTNDSEQDDQLVSRPVRRRVQAQENLWPYLPSDRLPMMWGSPPRSLRPQKAKQKILNGARHGASDVGEGRSSSANEGKNNKVDKRKLLSVISEHTEDGDGSNMDCDEDDDDDEEVDDEDDEDDGEDEDEDKWSNSDCWEVKHSLTPASSPGEGNVLRVHRVRSDADYVERDVSPGNDAATDNKDKLSNNNNNNYINKYGGSSVAGSLRCQNSHANSRGICRKTVHNLRTHSNSSSHISTETASQQNLELMTDNDEDQDDWNFGTHFRNQVNKERERLEAHMLKDNFDHEKDVKLDTEKCDINRCSNNNSKCSLHPARSYSYSNPDEYHHKKLHHAKRRHTVDSSQRITVTDVDCHQVKITFLESASHNGFFKPPTETRTG